MSRGHLCPVCVRPVPGDGRCDQHGPWLPHQLLTSRDRTLAARETWDRREVDAHACPRCLGPVAESRAGWLCLERADAAEPHGPYRVDELLGSTAQREAVTARMRLQRRRQAELRPAVTLPALPTIDLRHTVRLTASAVVVAATLAYLIR